MQPNIRVDAGGGQLRGHNITLPEFLHADYSPVRGSWILDDTALERVEAELPNAVSTSAWKSHSGGWLAFTIGVARDRMGRAGFRWGGSGCYDGVARDRMAWAGLRWGGSGWCDGVARDRMGWAGVRWGGSDWSPVHALH